VKSPSFLLLLTLIDRGSIHLLVTQLRPPALSYDSQPEY